MKKILILSLYCANFLLMNFSANAKTNLEINLDYAVFRADSSNYRIEFYYSYPDTSYKMRYNKEENIYYGNLEFILEIQENSSGKTQKYDWKTEYNLTNEQYLIAEKQDFYGIYNVFLNSGKYNATVTVKDLNDNEREFQAKFDLIIDTVTKEKLAISSIQIGNNIIAKKDSNAKYPEIFYKNQYYVYPNPLREISSDLPTLYLYSEIYFAKTLSPKGIEIKYEIKNAKNAVEFEYSKSKSSFADAIVETISIPIDAMQTGVYSVEMKVFSADKKDSVSQINKFYLINKNIALGGNVYYTEDEMFALSEFATFSEEKADFEFEQYKILAEKNEISTWEKLSELKAKQRFLFLFWKNRNPELADENYNKELVTFRERIKYANTFYSFGAGGNGWKSDRGKIYAKYGEPDQIDRSSETPIQKAYEIWSYSGLENDGKFCFIDGFGIGNFRLVHSTVSGHISNYDWESMLSKQQNSGQ